MTLNGTNFLIISFFIAWVAAACGGGQRRDDTTPNGSSTQNGDTMVATNTAGGPEWVRADCVSYFRTKGQTPLCGVGMVKGMNDPSLARTAAQGRGRTEIARTIEVKVTSALTDYQAQSTDSNGVLQGDQAIESISKQVSEVTLNGSRMIDSWIAPDGTFYALMALDKGDFTTAITESAQMEEPVRQVVLAVTPKLFSAYDDETSAY
ncbi:MAG: LPP20 family lipoprotein [Deltaproteobacteria bacterium]|nr:LPP20 family lipoprotein [Deltaproteobacteria bacterium]MBN2671891.1 LPP20 family lipoprotein [Deltaproteobacteria bacterium]